MKAWDKDKNGSLGPIEIDAVLADPKVTGDDAAAAAAIKCVARDRFYRVRRIDLATVKDDLRAAQNPNPAVSEEWFTADWQAAFEAARKRGQAFNAAGASAGVVAGAPNFAKMEIDAWGSSAFASVLAGVMLQRPDAVAAMVKESEKGLTVTTPLWSQQFGPITEGQAAACSTTGQSWVRAVECGLDVLNGERFPQAVYDGQVADFGARFARVQMYITLLTGKQSKVNLFRKATGMRTKDGWKYEPEGSPDGLASQSSQIIGQVLAQKRLAIAMTHWGAIVAATVKGPATSGPLPRGIPGYTCFTIVSLDAKQKTITLWSPYGNDNAPGGAGASGGAAANGHAMTNGQWTMPLNDFVLVFAGYVVEDQNAAALPGQSRGRK